MKPPSLYYSNRAKIEEANKQIDRMLADRNDPANWASAQAEAREALHVHLQFWPTRED
jgi:hypothetical protein